MRSTGMTRKIDEMGRIVIPIEIRRKFNINYNDSIGIYVEHNNIVLRNHESAGMNRKIDEMGRIVIPIEIRRKFSIDYNDPIDILTDDDKIILKKYEPFCIFCGESENTVTFMDKIVCRPCIEKLSKTVSE